MTPGEKAPSEQHAQSGTPQWDYDAFLSYSTGADYKLALETEDFLEGFHQEPGIQPHALRPLKICTDGSDFRLPRSRKRISTLSNEQLDPIKALIRPYLLRSASLVIAWPGRDHASPFMEWELDEFLRQNDENQWHRPVVLAVTRGSSPAENSTAFFSDRQHQAGLHEQVFYDFRGRHGEAASWAKVRDFDRERIRLAIDLATPTVPEATRPSIGELFPAWKRANETLERRQRRIATFVAVLGCTLALFAATGWLLANNRKKTADFATRSAQEALVKSFYRSIGTIGAMFLPVEEREALWELAALKTENASVRTNLLNEWSTSAPGILRAMSNDQRGLRAALGLTSGSTWLEPFSEELVRALQNSQEYGPDSDPDSLGAALATLATRMDAKSAATLAPNFIQALENTPESDFERIKAMGTALAALAAQMGSEPIAELSGRGAKILARTLENSLQTNSYRLIPLGTSLAALAVKLEPGPAGALATDLVRAMENSQARPSRMGALGRALLVLAASPKLEPGLATNVSNRGAQILVRGLKNPLANPSDLDAISWAVTALAAPSARIEAELAATLATDLVQALEKTQEAGSERVSAMVTALTGLAAKMKPESAAALATNLVQALEKTPDTNSKRLSALGTALGVLASQMESGAAGTLATNLVLEMENAQVRPFRLSVLGKVLTVLAAQMKSGTATEVSTRGARSIVLALENPQINLGHLWTLGRTLAAMAAPDTQIKAQSEAEIFGRGVRVLVQALVNQREPVLDSASFGDLQALASQMESGAAGTLATNLVLEMENAQVRPFRLSVLGRVLAVLAAQMKPGPAAAEVSTRGAQSIVLALEDPQETYHLAILGKALAVLSMRMEPGPAATVATRGARAIGRALHTQETDSETLSDLVASMAALATQMEARPAVTLATNLVRTLENPQVSPYRVATLGRALAVLAARAPNAAVCHAYAWSWALLDNVSEPGNPGKDQPADRKAFVAFCAAPNTTTNVLIELLKWPFCVGEAEKIVLTELEKTNRLNAKFEGSIGNFIRLAPSLGITREVLESPVKRPTADEALKELEDFLAQERKP